MALGSALERWIQDEREKRKQEEEAQAAREREALRSWKPERVKDDEAFPAPTASATSWTPTSTMRPPEPTQESSYWTPTSTMRPPSQSTNWTPTETMRPEPASSWVNPLDLGGGDEDRRRPSTTYEAPRPSLYDVPSATSGMQVGYTGPQLDTGVPDFSNSQEESDTRRTPGLTPLNQMNGNWTPTGLMTPHTPGNWTPTSFMRPASPPTQLSSWTPTGAMRSPTATMDLLPGVSAVRQGANLFGTALQADLDAFSRWGSDVTDNPTHIVPKAVRDFYNATPGGQYYNEFTAQQDKENPPGFQFGDIGKNLSRGFEWLNMVGSPLQTERAFTSGVAPGKFSVGESFSAVGATLDQMLNPLSANYVGSQGIGEVDQNDPFASSPVGLFTKQFNQLYTAHMQQFADVNQKFDKLPPKQREQAKMAYVNSVYGAQEISKAMDDILNKDQKVQELYTQARDAQNAGNDLLAAKLGAQANRLKNMSRMDIVQEYQHGIAGIAAGFLIDPTNLIPLDPLFEARAAYKRTKTFGIGVEEGVKNLDNALKQADTLLRGAMEIATKTAEKVVTKGTGDYGVRVGESAASQAAQMVTEAASSLGAGAYELLGKEAGVGVETARQILTKGGERFIKPGEILDLRTFWQRINPLARTAETKAALSADTLWQTASQLLANVTTKEDARRILTALVDNPQKLITEGIDALTSPGAASMVDEAGRYIPGAGLVANKYVVKEVPILRMAAEKLKNMASLVGEGAMVVDDVAGELEDVLYSTARQLNGLKPLDLPAGATKFKLVRQADGTGIIQYLDKVGKVVKETIPEVYYNAEVAYKNMLSAVRSAGKTGSRNPLSVMQNTQRSIMSDMFLNLRPANMIRNAANATISMLVDGVYNWTHTDDIKTFWEAKLGGMAPTTRIAKTFDPTAAVNWTRRFWPTWNPYASVMEAGANLTYGATSLFGRVPVGEQKFYMNAFHAAGERALTSGWGKTIEQSFLPTLRNLGLDEQTARTLADHVINIGRTGGKVDIAAAMREVISKEVIPFTLQSLGVPAETISLSGWKAINDLFSSALPEQVDEAARTIKSIFGDEINRYAHSLLHAPPQPGVYEWTKTALAHDGAEWLDDLEQAARKAGMNPEQAKAAAQATVSKLTETTNKAWETFRHELAQTSHDQAPAFAVDIWKRYTDILMEVRKATDDLSREAIRVNTDEAWTAKWTGMTKVVDDLTRRTEKLFTQGRSDLMDLAKGSVVYPNGSWWDVINRYTGYDDELIARTRTAGRATLTSPGGDPFAETIAASRQFVDKSIQELFEAFKRAPIMENYDLMVDALRKFHQYGAQRNIFLTAKRELLFKGKLSLQEYYKIRNAASYQMFDNAVLYNNVNKRIMVANGVAEQIASKLRWTDEFAGGAFQLIGKAADGIAWQARNLADGTIHTFVDAASLPKNAVASMPSVPQNIVNDFYAAIGQSEKIVDEVVADVGKTVASQPVSRSAGQLVSAEGLRAEGLTGGIPPTYHGTSAPIDKLAPAYEGSMGNLYGSGFYTTADQSIAMSYTKKGRKGSPTLYQVKWKGANPPNVLDLTKPLPENAYNTVLMHGDNYDLSYFVKPEYTGQQILDEFDNLVREENLTSTWDVEGVYDALYQSLSDQGFDAIMYTGGKRTGGKAHTVVQYFNTDNLELVKQGLSSAIPPTGITERGIVGVWRSKDTDTPVKIMGSTEQNGVRYYRIRTQDGHTLEAPISELHILGGDNKLYSMDQVAELKTSRESIDLASEEVAGAEEAAKAMRAEWDRAASAGHGYLKLETAVGKYVKEGIAQVPENKFEDLYGVTVAGRRIENQADVEALFEEYAKLRQRTEFARRTSGKATETYKTIRTTAEEAADPDALRAFREANPYTVNPANTMDAHGVAGGTNLYDQVSKDTARSVASGGAKTPEISDVARHQIEQLQKIEDQILGKLPEILGGIPNKLTPAQRIQTLDKLMQEVLPQYDNILAAAVHAGQTAADFAMLNFNDKRNIDAVLSMGFPFPYFFTRSAKNWAIRTMKKPAIARLWYNTQRAIANENKQADVPTRMEGSVPNPLHQYGIGRERLQNPVTFMLPYAIYFPDASDVDENDGRTAFEHWTNNIKQQMYPSIQIAFDMAMDKMYPLPNGKKRTDEYQLGDYVPLARIGGYAYQAATGTPGRQGVLNTGDQYDPYRIARQTGIMYAEGSLQKLTGITDATLTGQTQNKTIAMYANQIATNIAKGKDPHENIPKEYFDTANKVYTEASKAVGYDRFLSGITGWATGAAQYDYPEGEKKMRQASAEYGQLGYGPENWTGNLVAKKEQIAKTGLDIWWSKNATVPGSDWTQPYISAETIQSKQASDALWAANNKAKDDLLETVQDATSKEMYKAGRDAVIAEARQQVDPKEVDKFLEEYKAANKGKDASPYEIIKWVTSTKYPNAYKFEGSDKAPYADMSPAEKEQAQIEGVFKEAGDMPGEPIYPGDTATPAQKDVYRKAKAEYKKAKANFATARLTGSPYALGDVERGRLELTPEAVAQKYTEYQQRNMTDAEKKRMAEITAAQPLLDQYYDLLSQKDFAGAKALIDANPNLERELRANARTKDEFAAGGTGGQGKEAKPLWWEKGGSGQWSDEWSEYKALGKDNAAKAAYMRDHPDFAAMYKGKYGNAWWENYTGKGGNFRAARGNLIGTYGNEAGTLWDEYYKLPKDSDARKQFMADHPEMKVFSIAAYNPKEYKAATDLFGADAWMEWAHVPAYADTDEAKAARSAYFDQHPTAKLLNAWLNGRPANYSNDGGDDKRDFGKDYAEAQKLFGKDIWKTFVEYGIGWDSRRKAAFFDAHPGFSDFFSWWYGGEKRAYYGRRSTGRSGGYSGEHHGGHRGGGGSYRSGGGPGYGGGGSYAFRMPYIDPMRMKQELEVTDYELQQLRKWRPEDFNRDWMYAGQQLAPEKLARWKA